MVSESNNSVDRRADGRPRVRIAPEVLVALRGAAESGYPEEACGGLLGVRDASGLIELREAVPVPNARDDERSRRYLIGPTEVAELERLAFASKAALLGYYHSHPDAQATPSEFDREHAWPWYVYLIVGVAAGRATDFRAWRLAEDRAAFEPLDIVNDAEDI